MVFSTKTFLRIGYVSQFYFAYMIAFNWEKHMEMNQIKNTEPLMTEETLLISKWWALAVFTMGMANAAAAQMDDDAQRKMCQYVGVPGWLGSAYLMLTPNEALFHNTDAQRMQGYVFAALGVCMLYTLYGNGSSDGKAKKK